MTAEQYTQARFNDRVAENDQLRRDAAKAVRLIETGRTDEAVSLLRLISRGYEEQQ
ncbi:hypothetical protein [Streptomyces sp. XY431]|uniref:hypothetical protein n=1 Tax=Streptomyces sp. XY431 TaxID=1415562 RepID=UPI000A8EE2E7|nr:hypothetical protein [Streptomyces sp. XY431]